MRQTHEAETQKAVKATEDRLTREMEDQLAVAEEHHREAIADYHASTEGLLLTLTEKQRDSDEARHFKESTKLNDHLKTIANDLRAAKEHAMAQTTLIKGQQTRQAVLESQVTRLQTANKQLSKDLADMNALCAKRLNIIARRDATVSEHAATIAELEGCLAQAKTKEEQLGAQLAKLMSTKTELAGKVKALEESKASTEEALAKSNSDLNHYKEAKDDLVGQADEHHRLFDEQRKLFEEAQHTVKEQEETIKELEATIKYHKVTIEAHEKTIAARDEAIKSASQDAGAGDEELKQRLEAALKKATKYNSVRYQLEEAETTMKQQAETIAALKARRAEAAPRPGPSGTANPAAEVASAQESPSTSVPAKEAIDLLQDFLNTLAIHGSELEYVMDRVALAADGKVQAYNTYITIGEPSYSLGTLTNLVGLHIRSSSEVRRTSSWVKLSGQQARNTYLTLKARHSITNTIPGHPLRHQGWRQHGARDLPEHRDGGPLPQRQGGHPFLHEPRLDPPRERPLLHCKPYADDGHAPPRQPRAGLPADDSRVQGPPLPLRQRHPEGRGLRPHAGLPQGLHHAGARLLQQGERRDAARHPARLLHRPAHHARARPPQGRPPPHARHAAKRECRH